MFYLKATRAPNAANYYIFVLSLPNFIQFRNGSWL